MKIGNISFFKIFFIISLGIFLYLYYENSGIGRFQLGGVTHQIIDTKTGETFVIPFSNQPHPPILK